MHDPAKLFAENMLLRLLAELPAGTPPFEIDVSFNGMAAALRVGVPWERQRATGFRVSSSSELTPREYEIFEVVKAEVARVGHRLPGAAVRAALLAAGIRWGVSTVNTTLADLVEKGLLVNENDKRGYGLASQ